MGGGQQGKDPPFFEVPILPHKAELHKAKNIKCSCTLCARPSPQGTGGAREATGRRDRLAETDGTRVDARACGVVEQAPRSLGAPQDTSARQSAPTDHVCHPYILFFPEKQIAL